MAEEPEKIEEKPRGDDSSSSSSSDSDNEKSAPSSSSSVKRFRLFGRQQPVHSVLGGGKPANVMLWRDKKISAGVLGVATIIWVLFELIEYHLLALVCHILIFTLAILFLWASATAFINKSPPHVPDVSIPEDKAVNAALALRYEINRFLATLREIAAGRDLKHFLMVIAGLWFLSVIGSCCNFLTLFYIAFVLLHTVPVLYEKYEDKVDSFAERATAEAKKFYAVGDAKVLSKLHRGPLKEKQQ